MFKKYMKEQVLKETTGRLLGTLKTINFKEKKTNQRLIFNKQRPNDA